MLPALLLLSHHVDAAIINAGDGRREHPTQALLDALTIKRRFGHIEGLRIAICGDIANSRVARSNLYLLGGLGAEIRFVSPSTLLPPAIGDMGVNVYHDMKDGIKNCDIVMMLRLQTERMEGRETPSQHEYFNFFGLDKEKLEAAAPNAMIMHPGPMNRGVEIDHLSQMIMKEALFKSRLKWALQPVWHALKHLRYQGRQRYDHIL